MAPPPKNSTGRWIGSRTVCSTVWYSASMKTKLCKSTLISKTPRMPKNLPTTKTGRGTGLETTVRTVLSSISRLMASEATNAAKIDPAAKMVASPISSSMR